jgi:hypothetical protein
MVLAQNEICCVCKQPIGVKEKGCLYVYPDGYMHYSCKEKKKLESVLI